MTILERLKARLGIANETQDVLLDDYIQSYTDAVLNYCNREDLPARLEYVVIDLAERRFSRRGREDVQSLSRGDYKVSYAISPQEAQDELKPYEGSLNRFRKVKFI
jgi:hypothetical protein